MAWHSMAWHSMAQHGMAQHGMARHSMAQHGTAWLDRATGEADLSTRDSSVKRAAYGGVAAGLQCKLPNQLIHLSLLLLHTHTQHDCWLK